MNKKVIYVKLSNNEIGKTQELQQTNFSVNFDYDIQGIIRGIEFLSYEECKIDGKDLDSLDNWISCEDELPKNDSSVLVWDSDVNDVSFGYCIDKKWYFNRDGSLDTGITHWQPLPNPPKEK